MRPFLPSASINPHAGWGGGTPTPREESGQGKPGIGEPHDDLIDPAAEIAGDDAENGADEPRDDHGGEAYDHRDSGAEDEPREHVAPEVIGAEQVLLASARLPRRRPEAVAERPQLGSVGGEGVREDRDQRHRDDERRRDDRKPF